MKRLFESVHALGLIKGIGAWFWIRAMRKDLDKPRDNHYQIKHK